MTTGNLVPIERHNRLTAGPAVWTDTRVPIEVFGIACAVYGAGSEDDDKRIYRTIQAVLWKLATQSPAQEESPAAPVPDPNNPGWCIGCNPDNCVGCGNGLPAPVQPVGELFAYVHKRGAADEEFIHAAAVNGHCADCEPLFLGAALSTRPELSDAEIDAICAPDRAKRWKGDGRQYDRDTVRLALGALAARGEKPLVQGSGS